MKKIHPYKELLDFQYWKTGVEQKHFIDLKDIWNAPIELKNTIKIATAGSCFAQHVTKHIRMRDLSFLDLELKPDNIPEELGEKYGYGIYSCRYGNIYSVRQLLQLLKESLGIIKIDDIVWEKNGRYYDSLRPNVTPNGLDSPELVIQDRQDHLKRVKQMFETVDLFIFTMGMTECWMNKEHNNVYPTAPGVIANIYDTEKYYFHNFNYNEIKNDLEEFYSLLTNINKSIQIILTVSPVPLKATYTNQHIIVANNYSKSTLRIVASDFCNEHRNLYYFPSYEIINSHCNRAMFYESNLREINKFGVEFVMKHFFNDGGINKQYNENVICDFDEI